MSSPKLSNPYKNVADVFLIQQVNYRADYEKNKLNYTLPQDVPQMVKAKTNAELFSEVSTSWEKVVVGLVCSCRSEIPGCSNR